MAFLSFVLNLNHFYFVIFVIAYLIREWINNIISDNVRDNYSFGDTRKAPKKLFNMYIYTISNLFSLIFICIIKIRSKRKRRKESIKPASSESPHSLQYIYTGDLPVNTGHLLIKTIMISLFDFIAQFSVFILYLIVNDDSQFSKNDKMDILSIFNILSINLFSRIILKTYFYKHHYLSFGINIICIIILGGYELSQIDYTIVKMMYILVRIISIIFYSLEDVIGKKTLIEEFLNPYSLLIYKGLYELIIISLSSIPFFFIKRNEVTIFSTMGVLINGAIKIFLNILIMIINFIYTVIIWIIIDKFSPNDYAMATIIEGITGKIFDLLFYNSKSKKEEFNIGESIFYIIIYFILIIGICIHNEIIIINKCRLNEYTKKKLGKKGDEDLELTKHLSRNTSFYDEEKRKNNNFKRSTSEVVIDKKNLDINLVEKTSNSEKAFFLPLALENLEDMPE